MCGWVLRFKVIEFYDEKSDFESIINILKTELYMKKPKVKSLVVIEEKKNK